MSGFSSDWLALREVADRSARSRLLIAQICEFVEARGLNKPDTPLRITDLGCGTGATLRALDPYLPAQTQWHLVDNDADLLARAQAAARPGQRLTIAQIDLATAVESALAHPVDLVTASALIDLVSLAWLERLLDLMPAGAALYLALTYDGHELWEPADAAEPEALRAFAAHMCGDKGFGPALGGAAAETVSDMLTARGWTVHAAESPWQLGPTERALIEALADGAAAAVAETGALAPAQHAAWHGARRRTTRVEIGHRDILAFPP
ncbi:MAG: methyltransferase domain-containing protein [Pseudomonadota bacterium]